MARADDTRPAAARPCPICGKPPTREHGPFCSRRCADIDLHRWLAGTYAILARDDEEDEEGEGGSEPGAGGPKAGQSREPPL